MNRPRQSNDVPPETTAKLAPIDGIAVVLVTHNGMRFLDEQLESIACQSVLPSAVFLVDDRSDDGSKQRVIDFFAAYPDIRLVVVDPPGPPSPYLYTRVAANFSAGLRAASAYRFIALADQDDVWQPQRLQQQRDRLLTTGALMTAGDAMVIDDAGAPTGTSLRQQFPALVDWEIASPARRLKSILRGPTVTGAASMVTNEMASFGLPIPAGWLHDRWWSLVAVARNQLDIDDTAVLRYRVYAEQAVGFSGVERPSGWQRVLTGIRQPVHSASKFRDLMITLPRSADATLASELSARKLLDAYLLRPHHVAAVPQPDPLFAPVRYDFASRAKALVP
ncbi:glycosyltransferase [Skermania sp. ID1734]|uniref:glycosyltransferase n=1 Tax=Skermania sp. ID1734 TaxID=2597516 RepID=UPI00117BF028|nr:glycosyltransferase [Skermania sp. ID1734]TSD93138.1 glycosyltransferase [Skermania sp. ID1734]